MMHHLLLAFLSTAAVASTAAPSDPVRELGRLAAAGCAKPGSVRQTELDAVWPKLRGAQSTPANPDTLGLSGCARDLFVQLARLAAAEKWQKLTQRQFVGVALALIAKPLSEYDLADEIEAADRRELVRPAPKGFKPRFKGRKAALRLVAREKTIHVGEGFWYRLELQNVGSQPIQYDEDPSFLKDGADYTLGMWDFYVTPAGGEREPMVIGTMGEEFVAEGRESPPKKTAKQLGITDEEWGRREFAAVRRAHMERGLRATLAPGETLLSRPWKWVTEKEYHQLLQSGATDYWPQPPGEFRELWTLFQFEKPGKYTIEAEYVDTPLSPPDEKELQEDERAGRSRKKVLGWYREWAAEHLGRVRSNRIVLEVLP